MRVTKMSYTKQNLNLGSRQTRSPDEPSTSTAASEPSMDTDEADSSQNESDQDDMISLSTGDEGMPDDLDDM
jgi:hypothetical protein